MGQRLSDITRIIAVIITLSLLMSMLLIVHLVMPAGYTEEWREIEIPDGASYKAGINVLIDYGILQDGLTLLLLGRITNSDRMLKPGFYHFNATMSPLEIFSDLIQGKTIQYSITIPEGSALKDIKKKFIATGLMDEESWSLVYDKDFLESLDIDAPSLEGYIYPDTYNFSKGTPPEVIFKVMVQKMRDMFDESMMTRASELNMTENEVLTLASIIEKEAIFDSERPLISAVYHNRLKRNMRLQADPTVLYGVKKRWKRIRYRDLKRKTPYNTYLISGLPPGPIASPGLKSIMAALYPADVDYLYFVSKNNGRHHFSRTNREHWEAVVYYQLNGKKKIRKAKKDKTDNPG